MSKASTVQATAKAAPKGKSVVRKGVGVSATSKTGTRSQGSRSAVEQAVRRAKVKVAQRLGTLATGKDGWDELVSGLRVHAKAHLSSENAYLLARSGMPARLVEPISARLGMTKGDLATFMGVDRSTTTRLKASDKSLSMHASESVLRLIEMQELAEEVFGTAEKAHTWLHKPHSLFNDEAPYTVAASAYGAQRVKQVLVAIQYGGVV